MASFTIIDSKYCFLFCFFLEYPLCLVPLFAHSRHTINVFPQNQNCRINHLGYADFDSADLGRGVRIESLNKLLGAAVVGSVDSLRARRWENHN